MAHLYEYSMIFNFIPQNFPLALTIKRKEGQESIAKECTEFANELPDIIDTSSEGEGWVVNSHSITVIENTLILSILVQRNHK